MKIDTLGVQAFIAIATHRNFRRASVELHITQTALSRRKGASWPTAAVTRRISVRLTEQAKARQASQRGSPGHCSSNLRTVTASFVAKL